MSKAIDHLNRSEAASRLAHDLLEQAPAGLLNEAATEVLASVRHLQAAVREQQRFIDRLLAAVPSADEKA